MIGRAAGAVRRLIGLPTFHRIERAWMAREITDREFHLLLLGDADFLGWFEPRQRARRDAVRRCAEHARHGGTR